MSEFTRAEREKHLAWLKSENEKAETWGAAIAARNEEIEEIEAVLAREENQWLIDNMQGR